MDGRSNNVVSFYVIVLIMKTIIHRVSIALLFGLFSLTLFAQEKNQSYYYHHQDEILPDANAAFQKGNYGRSIDLCLWHYIIVGDSAADSLREKAESCAHLSEEMNRLFSTGNMVEAKRLADSLLQMNPDDLSAKRVRTANPPSTIPELKKTKGREAEDVLSNDRFELSYNSENIPIVGIITLKTGQRYKLNESQEDDIQHLESLDNRVASVVSSRRVRAREEGSTHIVAYLSDGRKMAFILNVIAK